MLQAADVVMPTPVVDSEKDGVSGIVPTPITPNDTDTGFGIVIGSSQIEDPAGTDTVRHISICPFDHVR